MRPVPFPLKVRRLRLGLGIEVGFCALPGKRIAMGFASGRRLAPVAVAEENRIRPVKKLQELVKGIGEVTLRSDGKGGQIAAIQDPFGSATPLGRLKEEGEKWGLEDVRIPLPKAAATSLSLPGALSTLFMGVYLPSILSGFPAYSPTSSVFYHFFTQNAGSAISNVLEDARACRNFSLVSSGLELVAALSIKESGVEEAFKGKGGMGSISSSFERDFWSFSSPAIGGEESLKKLGSFLTLAYFAGDSSPYPFGFWEFLDAMERCLEDPLSRSPFKKASIMAGFAASKAKEFGKGALDPDGEWVQRSAFFSAADAVPLPLPISYSVSFSSPPGKAALVLEVGASWRIPEFLAPHPLGRRRLLFLFSLSAARMLAAAAFGAARNVEEVDLFIESRDSSSQAARPRLLAKGSFSRGEFLSPGEPESAEEFFRDRFKGDMVRSPYFSPIFSDKDWMRPPFSAASNRKPPEFSWEEMPGKFAPALGTSFVADLSMDRSLVLYRAIGAFESIAELVRSGKMSKEEGEEKADSICRLIPDPEIVRAGSELSSLIRLDLSGKVFRPRLEGEIEGFLREAQRLAKEEGRLDEAARILERCALEAQEGFDSDPMAPARYFHSYLERIVYNRLLASSGEYTVLLPASLFAIHLELEELSSRQKDSRRALEHANWQVLHAPATPLAHLNQYKELSAAKDWEAARAAAMNMLGVSVEARQVAMAYRNLGYCSWVEEDLPLASALYRMAGVVDGKEEMIRTEGRLLEAMARSSHILLPSAQESLSLLKERSIPAYSELPAVKAARRAAEALVDCGLFLPASAVLNSLSTLPGASLEGRIASTLFF